MHRVAIVLSAAAGIALIFAWKFTAVPLGSSIELPNSKITLDQTIDAGIVLMSPVRDDSWTVSREITLRNPSTDRQLSVTLQSASCSCTSISGLPCQIPPGRSVALTIAMNLPYVEGSRSANISLATDWPDLSQINLMVRAYSMPRIAIVPLEYKPLELRPGEARETDVVIHIAYDATEDGEPVEIECVDGQWEALAESGEDRGGISRRIIPIKVRVRCPEDTLSERIATTIVCRHVGNTLSRKLEWMVVRGVTANPKRLFIKADGSTAIGTIELTAEKPFHIKPRPGAPFNVSAQHEGRVCRLAVEVNRIGNDRYLRDELLVETDLPDTPLLRIPVFVLWPK